MNIDQLMESLSENAPDAGDVLASFGRKRRTARNRMYATSGGLAVAVVTVVAGVLLHGVGTNTASTAESRPAAGIAAPAATPAGRAPAFGQNDVPNGSSRSSASSAASCGTVRLQADLAEAVRKGASVIVGYGTLASGVRRRARGRQRCPGLLFADAALCPDARRPDGDVRQHRVDRGGDPGSRVPAPAPVQARPRPSRQPSHPVASCSGSFRHRPPLAFRAAVLQAAPVSDGQVLLEQPGLLGHNRWLAARRHIRRRIRASAYHAGPPGPHHGGPARHRQESRRSSGIRESLSCDASSSPSA